MFPQFLSPRPESETDKNVQVHARLTNGRVYEEHKVNKEIGINYEDYKGKQIGQFFTPIFFYRSMNFDTQIESPISANIFHSQNHFSYKSTIISSIPKRNVYQVM